MGKFYLLRGGIEYSFVLYALLFLSCLNFMGRGPVIFLLFCLWGITKTYKTKIKWNLSSICYLLMAFFAMVASFIYFDGKEILKSFVYFLSFIVGYKGYVTSQNKDMYIKRIIFSAFLGYFVNLIITYYVNFLVIGHVAGQRELYSFWTNDLMSVTLAGLMSSVPIAYSFYCFFIKNGLTYKILGAICIIVVAVVNMGTATRTPFVLTGVVYVYMIYELLRSKNVKNKGRIIVVVILSIFLISYKVLPNIADSAIADRFTDEGVNTSRTDITLLYIDKMMDYPYGGSKIYTSTKLLAHNFMFEAYDMYGLMFFVVMIILFVFIICRFFALHKLKLKKDVTFLLLAVYVAIGIQAMLEPVIGGYPQLVWTLFLIDGMTIPYLQSCNNRFINKN